MIDTDLYPELPDNVKKAYEKYIQGEKKEAFSLLIPGSQYHSYLYIIDAFKSEKGNLSAKTKDMISKFKKNWPGRMHEKLHLQSLLLSYDSTKVQKTKDSILKEIDDSYLHGNYSYSKPTNLKSVDEGILSKNSNPKRKSKSKNRFNQEKFFNLESTLNKATKNRHEIHTLHRSLLNKIDYSHLKPDTFSTFLSTNNYLSEITQKSFLKSLIEFTKEQFKKN